MSRISNLVPGQPSAEFEAEIAAAMRAAEADRLERESGYAAAQASDTGMIGEAVALVEDAAAVGLHRRPSLSALKIPEVES
jgi:hypothetical protein